jgi:hypothetical protein
MFGRKIPFEAFWGLFSGEKGRFLRQVAEKRPLQTEKLTGNLP